MNRALINASSGIVQKPLRYVLYVRKSSEDAEAQAKSLPDQIADCKEYANNHGLLLVGEPIQESKSAKKSGNRPLFSQMLKDIEKGKYDAILAWHPDRLSRNSLEAGMVVDMVDNGVIKDLRFPTFEFHNDSSGKLTLNMLFALSKQYSEHLSESVQRGVDSNLEQGKSGGMPKWGYIRDDVSGYYKPDKNFKMIQKGWQMILNGASQMEVYRYWKMNNVERSTKLSRRNKHVRSYGVCESTANRIFHDPFYYGILEQGRNYVDLRVVTPNFKPMVTEEEFDQVQKMFRKDRGSIQSSCYENQKATHGKYFLPFRHLIKCSVCGHYLIPARNRGHSGTYYLNYRCHNKACTRPKNNIRMHVIMDQLYEEFGRISQKYDFTSFVDDMTEYANKKMQELSVEKHELLGQKTQKQRKIDDLAEKYAELDKESPKAVKDKLKKDMADLQNDVVNIDERIKQIEAKIKNPEKLRMTIEKFSNSLNSLINRLEKGDLVEKDILVRNMVSNLEIDAQKRVIYRYKSPFNFIFEPEFSTGSPVGDPGGARTLVYEVPRVPKQKSSGWSKFVVIREGLEPSTPSLRGSCSNQLSYRTERG